MHNSTISSGQHPLDGQIASDSAWHGRCYGQRACQSKGTAQTTNS